MRVGVVAVHTFVSALPFGTPRGLFCSLLMSGGRKTCGGSQPLRTQLWARTPCLPSTKKIVNDVLEHIHGKYHVSPMRIRPIVVVTLGAKHTAEPCETENDPLGREDLEHPRTRLAEQEVGESGPVSCNHAFSVCHPGCLLAQRHCLKTDDLKASWPQRSCDDVFFIEDVPSIHAP